MSDDADAIASLGAKVSAIETDLAHERELSQMLLGIVINFYGAALEVRRRSANETDARMHCPLSTKPSSRSGTF